MIDGKKIGWGYDKDVFAEKLYSVFPEIYDRVSKTDSSLPSPLQKYLSDMDISGVGGFKKLMKEMMSKFPAEFGADSLKAAHTIMQNLDERTKKTLNKELVQAGCAGPEKTKKLFDAWAGLSPEMSKRVVFTGMSMS
jgi:Sec-independent protein translocase protein TatA